MKTTVTNIDCIEKGFTADADLIEYTQSIFDENEGDNEAGLVKPTTVLESLTYIDKYTSHELETDIKFKPMTKLEKVKILDEECIEHYIDSTGTLMAFCKMTASDGNDCSEWLDATDVIEALKENRL